MGRSAVNECGFMATAVDDVIYLHHLLYFILVRDVKMFYFMRWYIENLKTTVLN